MPPEFLSTLTATRNHLLLVAPDEGAISRLTAMIIQSKSHIGIISDDYPLLINLTALENIVLGCMYHNSLSLDSCREKLQPLIDRLSLHTSMEQRPQFLSRAQRLKIFLLRCLANESTFVFLPTPSRSDCDILHRAVDALEREIFLWASCLSNDKDVYTSLEYPVIDLKL